MSKFKEKLLQASFKGVNFFVNNHSSEFGYRFFSHALPFKNEFENQELGKKQRSYNVTGYVVGDDYFKLRDDLIAKVEEGGIGELVHPYLGRLSVICPSIVVAESSEKGRFCALNFQFIESSKPLPIAPKIDKAAVVNAAANKTKLDTLNDFQKAYNFITNSVKEISGKIREAQESLKEVMDTVRDVENLAGSIAQIATDFTYLVKNARGVIDRIAAFPDFVGGLLNDVLSAFDKVISGDNRSALPSAISSLALPGMFATTKVANEAKNQSRSEKSDESRKKLEAYKSIYNKEINTINKINSNSSESIEVKKNINEIQKFVQIHALSSACSYAASTTFLTISEANKVRDELVVKIDQLMNDPSICDDVFTSLYNLRSVTYDALVSIADEIPIIKYFKVHESQNIINFCFENLGTLENMEDIILLNNINDPAYINAGLNLAVIFDDRTKNKQ
jgi:prophage DNA circulation protein